MILVVTTNLIFQNLLLVALSCTLIKSSLGANILVFQGASMKSHLYSVASVLEELAPYHNFTFYIGHELNYKYENITVRKTVGLVAREALIASKVLSEPCHLDPYGLYLKQVIHENDDFYKSVYEDVEMQKLIKSQEKYDLIFINGYVSEHYFPFIHKFNVPVIQISPSILLPWVRKNAGEPQYWDSDINFIVTENSDSFIGRLAKCVKTVRLWLKYYYKQMPCLNRALKKYFPPSTPQIEDLTSRVHLVFMSTHSAMGFSTPKIPNIIQIGGLSVKPPKALPADLKAYLDEATEGVIYFSLGSIMPESTMTTYVRNSILRTFEKMKQRVLWKIDENGTNVPGNVRVSKWFPQQSILSHPNVKLFIMQGGMLSLTESISFGVPVLIMPVIFDQISTGHVAQKMGYGLTLDFCAFTEEKFNKKVNELLNNHTYREKAKQISEILRHDVPNIKRNVKFWTDFVLRNRNSVLEKMKESKSWMETLPTDIFLALLSIALLAILIICCTLSFLKNRLLRYRKQKEE